MVSCRILYISRLSSRICIVTLTVIIRAVRFLLRQEQLTGLVFRSLTIWTEGVIVVLEGSTVVQENRQGRVTYILCRLIA
jgi:hypothetical protein